MSAELVACPQCSRKNNALRPTCIYCGAALPVVQEISPEMVARAGQARERDNKLDLDPLSQISTQLQQSTPSFHLILLPVDAQQVDKAVQIMVAKGSYNDSDARQLLKLSHPVPVARYQHELEAKAIYEQLQGSQLPLKVISDEQMLATTQNPRCRRLQVDVLNGVSITVTPENMTEPLLTLPASEIKLIVEGKIRTRQYEATEENKGFGKTDRELTSALEFTDEQPLLDVYTGKLETSFRVRSEAFDYSGLGTKLKLSALKNFRMLVTVLCDVAKNAVYDNDYKQSWKILETVWPSLRRNESLGLRRAKMLTAGKIATRSVYHTDNELQFNRYSRLSYYLLGETKKPPSSE